MAETKYREDPSRFDYTGMDLNRPVDSIKPGKLAYVKNMRPAEFGSLVPRAGLTLIGTAVSGQTPLHSIRRLNDPANATWTRVLGAGTHVAYGQTSFTDLDSGYSGDPLALVPWRPKDSPTPFMYVADRSRMRKVGLSGALHTVGLAPPTAAPGVAPSAPSYKTIDGFQATTGWAAAGTAGAPALLAYRASTTITQIVYDVGTTGWCSIQPASIANIGQGCRLNINPGGGADEFVTVQAVYPGSLSTTIGAISYDSGTSGLCSLTLATSPFTLYCDVLVRNATTSENARIVGVVPGPDGTSSLRLSTPSTWAAGNTIAVLPTIRTYTVNNHATTEVARIDGMRSAVTSGTGTLTKTSALDLSVIATGVPTQQDDYIHISMRVSDPTVITEIKAQMDVDSGTNDFMRNYYWRSFRADDLTFGAANLQSLLAAKQALIQKAIINTSRSISGGLGIFALPEALRRAQAAGEAAAQQFASGSSQWAELRFRVSDLIRIGSDTSRTLQNVAALRLVFIVTGNVNIDVDSWWIGGGTGPDTGNATASPLHYRYRVRNPATNVASNFSPATRYDATALRQTLTVTPTQYAAPSGTSLSTSDFVIDIERFGGDLPEWHYIATIPNASSPSFSDVYADVGVAGQPLLGNDNYQPWPVIGLPVTGTTGVVAGTTVNDGSTTFNTAWAPGTRMLIGNQPYTIYRVISTSKLELFENAGAQSAVTWRIDEPVTQAQPLACLWEDDGYLLGCGDPVNPGRLYYTNRGTETTGTRNYLDVTAPSEPLQNGRVFNVRSFLWSTGNLFQILHTNDVDNPFRHEQVPGGKGLFSRWGAALGPANLLFWVAADGIYASTGGEPVSMTDADLFPLFPNEGNLGSAITPASGCTVDAPDISAAQATAIRLAFNGEYLYLDFPPVGSSSVRRTLVLAFDAGAISRGEAQGGWFYDIFTPSIVTHYGEEGAGLNSLLVGGTDGKLYQYTGLNDNTTGIACVFLTPGRDQGEIRERKLYGDIMLDANCDGITVTVTPFIDNASSSVTATTLATTTRTMSVVPVGASWTSAKNVALKVSFTVV